VLLEQVFLHRAGVHADADRDAGGFRGGDDLPHLAVIADVAGVDAQLGGAGFGGFDGKPPIVVDVGDDRQGAGRDYVGEGRGGGVIGDRDADDVGPGGGHAADLVHRRGDVAGVGLGHRLDGDATGAADLQIADGDGTGEFAGPGEDIRQR